MERNGKIFNSLWIIASFIIFFNGLGFVYIGSKTRNEKWIMEGCIYEIPWLSLIIETGLLNSSLGTYIVGLGLLLLLVSIIRSIMVNYEMENLSLDVFYENTSQSSIKTPIQSEVEINEDIKENKAPNEESPYKDKLPEINNLSEEFKTKENKASQLIEKRFKSSELTYDKFKSVLTSAHENFYIQRDSALEIINLSSHKNEKLDSELSKRINALESILEKVNQLIEALVIDSIESRESEEDLKVLVEDMENLINSVEDYN
jgi:hypothetical protein